MSTFYFKYIKSEPGWKSSFMVEFLSAEFTCKDVALYLSTWALNNKPGNFVLGFIRKGFRLDWMNTSFLFSLPPNLMYLILDYSQRQEVIKRTKLFLNKEGPSRRAILKKSNDLFQRVFGNVWVHNDGGATGLLLPWGQDTKCLSSSIQWRIVLPRMPLFLPVRTYSKEWLAFSFILP